VAVGGGLLGGLLNTFAKPSALSEPPHTLAPAVSPPTLPIDEASGEKLVLASYGRRLLQKVLYGPIVLVSYVRQNVPI
jgi:hypothetical protein